MLVRRGHAAVGRVLSSLTGHRVRQGQGGVGHGAKGAADAEGIRMSEIIIDWTQADPKATVAVIDPAERQVQFWRTRPVLTAQTPEWQRPTWRDPQEKVGNFLNAYKLPEDLKIPSNWKGLFWEKNE